MEACHSRETKYKYEPEHEQNKSSLNSLQKTHLSYLRFTKDQKIVLQEPDNEAHFICFQLNHWHYLSLIGAILELQ